MKPPSDTRRRFLKQSAGAAAGAGVFQIVQPHVLGGPKHTPPSETFGAALIGVGGRGPGTFRDLSGKHGLAIREIAMCDVKYKGSEDNDRRYSDFRRLLERKDLDIVAIATPPHWHALISIAAMEAGKDVLCEKPMTRFISEGRAVADAVKRTGQVYQIGTYGRFGQHNSANKREMRKIIRAGFAKGREVRAIKAGGFKIKQWSGPVNVPPREPPKNLDWDLYCGPSPLRPFQPPRFGGEADAHDRAVGQRRVAERQIVRNTLNHTFFENAILNKSKAPGLRTAAGSGGWRSPGS